VDYIRIVFRIPNSPPIRHHHFLQVVSEPSLAHLERFSFAANRADTF
jgi:hypothetical protein